MLKIRDEKKGYTDPAYKDCTFTYVSAALDKENHWRLLVVAEDGTFHSYFKEFFEVTTKLDVVLK